MHPDISPIDIAIRPATTYGICLPVLVTGCGRSGTRYTARVLSSLGLDIGHETIGSDGVVSWYHAVKSDEVPFGDPRGQTEYRRILHQVREPLAVIESARSFSRQSWEWISLHTDIDPDEPFPARSARYWLKWNSMVEKQAHFRFKIEDFDLEFENICEFIDLVPNSDVLSYWPRDINTRRYNKVYRAYSEACGRLRIRANETVRRILSLGRYDPNRTRSWSALASCDSRLAADVRDMAERYGYRT